MTTLKIHVEDVVHIGVVRPQLPVPTPYFAVYLSPVFATPIVTASRANAPNVSPYYISFTATGICS